MDFDVKYTASQQSSAPSKSSENFQKFIYDLFEKNGILNNLRAHLRSHIINVLKSATNDNQPASPPKNFKKHLEPKFQALNVLLAEYLLKMELNYSLSVFVSEIPLVNMPFGFAKLLMQKPDEDVQNLKLTEDDIILILNFLGVHCDSDLICQVMGLYKSNDVPLLQCILQTVPLHRKKFNTSYQDFAVRNLVSHSSSSLKSSDFEKNPTQIPYCNHINKCTLCEAKVSRIKEKYSEKLRQYKKNDNSKIYSRDMKSINLSNIYLLEKRLIDEMFQEVRSVYESELQMVKSSEERRISASVAGHAIALKKRIAQLEEQYRTKETQLYTEVRDKKQLLHTLMDSIQQEHRLLSKTIQDINQQAQKLAQKENQMKRQINDAEQFIKQRSEQMTNQIQSELELLLSHLRTLKEEKHNIAKEKFELENLKKYCERKDRSDDMTKEFFCKVPEHMTMTSELRKLKECVDKLCFNKNFTEQSTLTELNGVTSKINVILNNEQDAVEERANAFKITPNKLFNQFRKEKNINFSSSDPEETRREPQASYRLRNISTENENLRRLAAQQNARIQELNSEVAQAHTILATPNEMRATVFQPFNTQLQRLSAVPGSSGATGGGEELSLFPERPGFSSAPGSIGTPEPRAHCSRSRPTRHISKPSKTRRGANHDKVLQEARRTLRKLEIEAEAVHNSYVVFKRKREGLNADSQNPPNADPNFAKHPNNSLPNEIIVLDGSTQLAPHNDKLFNCVPESVRLVSPIPDKYSTVRPAWDRTRNLIETPLNEFRKLYNSVETKKDLVKGVSINDERVLSTTNLDNLSEIQNMATSFDEKVSLGKSRITDVYTCNIVEVNNRCPEICVDVPSKDSSSTVMDEKLCLLRVEVENFTSTVVKNGSEKPIVLEIESCIDAIEVEKVPIKPNKPNDETIMTTSVLVSSVKDDNETNSGLCDKKFNTESAIAECAKASNDYTDYMEVNNKIEKLKMENDDYHNEDFEESSTDENMSSKSERSFDEKLPLNTINEEEKSLGMLEFLSSDLEEQDEYPDDFTDFVASGDSPKSFGKSYTDNDNFWQTS